MAMAIIGRLHPLLIQFPILLVLAAVPAEIAAIVVKNDRWRAMAAVNLRVMKVSDDRLRKVLGLSRMSFHALDHPIAIIDLPLDPDANAASKSCSYGNVDRSGDIATRIY